MEITTWYTLASNGNLIPDRKKPKKAKKKISKPKKVEVKTLEPAAELSLQERVEAQTPVQQPVVEQIKPELPIIVEPTQEKIIVPQKDEFEVRTGKYDALRRSTFSNPSPTIGEMASKHNGHKVPYDPLRPACFYDPEKRQKQGIVSNFNVALAEVLQKLSPLYKSLAEQVKACPNNLWEMYKKSQKKLGEQYKENGDHGFLSRPFLVYVLGKAGKLDITAQHRTALYLEMTGKGPERIFALKHLMPLELQAISKAYAAGIKDIRRDVTTDE
ncbi:MAG: hypothetical protein EPN86_02385 [Nanoarchaeota archaeon]|nr:MAG: hypothetical protein EPN86_02385 [Nanoarchaeota archaeon]